MYSNKNYELSMANFESSTIEKHYTSKRSMAFAYLMTVGSKALIITDSLILDSDKNNDTTDESTAVVTATKYNDTSIASMIKALDEENEIKQDIIHEEEAVKSLKKFQMNIMNPPGMLLFKRGRNGKSRRLFIQVLCTPFPSSASTPITSDCLMWKSNMMGQKIFQLNTLKSIKLLKEHELDVNNNKASKSSSGSNNDNDTAATVTTTVSKPSSDPNKVISPRKLSSSSPVSLITTDYIRLINEDRSLDIKFYSSLDSVACIRFLSSYLIQNNPQE